MVVVALLLAIAAPSYRQSVRKSKRGDAKTALLDLASKQERYFSTRNTYVNDATKLGYAAAFPISVPGGSQQSYNLTVTAATATTFTATATPQGDQASDDCGTYKIDQAGNQTVTGTIPASQCW